MSLPSGPCVIFRIYHSVKTSLSFAWCTHSRSSNSNQNFIPLCRKGNPSSLGRNYAFLCDCTICCSPGILALTRFGREDVAQSHMRSIGMDSVNGRCLLWRALARRSIVIFSNHYDHHEISCDLPRKSSASLFALPSLEDRYAISLYSACCAPPITPTGHHPLQLQAARDSIYCQT